MSEKNEKRCVEGYGERRVGPGVPRASSGGRAAVIAAAAVASLMAVASEARAEFDVIGKNIPQLHTALANGDTTVQAVVQQYLDRIAIFNRGPRGISAVSSLNPNVMADAAAVDALIAGGATKTQYPLLGVPMIIKDSYNVQGLVTTNGVSVLNGKGPLATSTTLVAPSDAFSVAQLKAAGAVIIGKSAQTTMAYAYDGVDNNNGVVRNPYQPNRWPGGSSSGSGAGIASQFAMLAMGGETGGSIRVPANANNLVGLKTSLGLIDPGGTWPLTPSRDVVGPLGKTVSDIAYAMNALVKPSPTNLFNGTPFYPTANPGTVRPADYTAALSPTALQGKVLAVPKGLINSGGGEGNVAPAVMAQFNLTLDKLRAEGATIVYVDIPATTKYFSTIARPNAAGGATTVGFGYAYPTTTVGGTTPSNTWSSWAAAYYYNELIKSYNDPVVKNLADFATALRAGRDADTGFRNGTTAGLTGAYNNINALVTILNAGNAKGFGDANNDGAPDNPDAMTALKAFSDLRKAEYEGFMDAPNLVDDPSTSFDESTVAKIDSFVAPTYGTIMQFATVVPPVPGYATANDPSWTIAGGASLLGRFESNILGAPSMSVPMGFFPDGTPMGFQFMGKFNGEFDMLGFAYDYEQANLTSFLAPDLTFVPEPSAVALLLIPAMSLGRRRRAHA